MIQFNFINCISNYYNVTLNYFNWHVQHGSIVLFVLQIGQAILGDNRETLITALCLGLEDSNTLTQRNFLDFVLLACPLNSKITSRPTIS